MGTVRARVPAPEAAKGNVKHSARHDEESVKTETEKTKSHEKF